MKLAIPGGGQTFSDYVNIWVEVAVRATLPHPANMSRPSSKGKLPPMDVRWNFSLSSEESWQAVRVLVNTRSKFNGTNQEFGCLVLVGLETLLAISNLNKFGRFTHACHQQYNSSGRFKKAIKGEMLARFLMLEPSAAIQVRLLTEGSRFRSESDQSWLSLRDLRLLPEQAVWASEDAVSNLETFRRSEAGFLPLKMVRQQQQLEFSLESRTAMAEAALALASDMLRPTAGGEKTWLI
jgi:hypothetical protein